jgi:hypothetical protein
VARRAFAASREALLYSRSSLLRRAELDLLDAETALADTNAAAAARALRAAAPVYEAEYPEGHPERAHLRARQAHLALLRDQVGPALELALAAREVLRGPGGADSGRAHAERIARIALARAGRCDDLGADDANDAEGTTTPRDRAEQEWMRAEVARRCAGRP